MNKLITALLCIAALLAAALPAGAAAKPVKYVGKTNTGHKVTFKLVRNKKMDQFVAATSTQCISIQGGGRPFVGAEPWPSTSFRLNTKAKGQMMLKPAFYYNEVTTNLEVTTKKLRNGTITGKLRRQYEFLIPKYPIGTFQIYSCLGDATFKAKPVR
jgi:hypothetical protein